MDSEQIANYVFGLNYTSVLKILFGTTENDKELCNINMNMNSYAGLSRKDQLLLSIKRSRRRQEYGFEAYFGNGYNHILAWFPGHFLNAESWVPYDVSCNVCGKSFMR